MVFGLGLSDELVNDARLGEIGVISVFRGQSGDCYCYCYCVVFAQRIGEEGEVCVNELLERREHIPGRGVHFCGEGAAVGVGKK